MTCVSTGTAATITFGDGTVSLVILSTTVVDGATQICYRLTNNANLSLGRMALGVCPTSTSCTIPPLPPAVLSGASVTFPAGPCAATSVSASYPGTDLGICGVQFDFFSPIPPGGCLDFCHTLDAPTTLVPWRLADSTGNVTSESCTITGFDCAVVTSTTTTTTTSTTTTTTTTTTTSTTTTTTISTTTTTSTTTTPPPKGLNWPTVTLS